MALAAIIKEENLEVSDEEADAEFQKLADQYGMDLETVKQYLKVEQVKDQLITRKAVAVVVDSATATKPEKPAAKKSTKKDEDAEGEEEKKPAKKSTKKAAEKDGEEEKKPAKKAAAKKTVKKTDEEPAESK